MWLPFIIAILGTISFFILRQRKRKCVFCEILKSEIRAVVRYEDEHCFVIDDLSPVSSYHFLVIPRAHIIDFNHLKREDIKLVKRMINAGRKVLEENLDKTLNFKMGFSKPPFISVRHLHLHCFSVPLHCNAFRTWLLTSKYTFIPVLQGLKYLKTLT